MSQIFSVIQHVIFIETLLFKLRSSNMFFTGQIDKLWLHQWNGIFVSINNKLALKQLNDTDKSERHITK
jgi:hypothetical protein